MSKKYLLIILSISIIALITYFMLGGFKSPETTVVYKPSVSVYGTYYDGTIGSDSLRGLFLIARELVESTKELKAIAIVYYGNVNEENGLVKNFIGVDASAVKEAIEYKNWEYRSFSAPNSIKACVEANVLAMPTPNNLLKDLRAYGIAKEIKADSIFIEYYAGPNNLCVELLSK
jgi:hypothetical protein